MTHFISCVSFVAGIVSSSKNVRGNTRGKQQQSHVAVISALELKFDTEQIEVSIQCDWVGVLRRSDDVVDHAVSTVPDHLVTDHIVYIDFAELYCFLSEEICALWSSMQFLRSSCYTFVLDTPTNRVASNKHSTIHIRQEQYWQSRLQKCALCLYLTIQFCSI